MKIFVGYKDLYKLSINGIRYKERVAIGFGTEFNGIDAAVSLEEMANKDKSAEFYIQEIDVFKSKEEYISYKSSEDDETERIYRFGKEKYELRKELEEVREKLGENVKPNFSGKLFEVGFKVNDKQKSVFFDNYLVAYNFGEDYNNAEIIEIGKELKKYRIGTEEASLKKQIELEKIKLKNQ